MLRGGSKCAMANPGPVTHPAQISIRREGWSAAWGRAVQWSLLCLALAYPFLLPAQQKRDAPGAEARWETLTGCRLRTNSIVDGDSFHVLHRDREYIFRLYFVDAPENDESLKDRANDQSEYFGIRPADIPRAGKLASQFTRDALSGREFTVITRWQNAMGRSTLARFYAIVLVNGKNLAEELVSQGYARIYGLRANWPDGPRSATFINKLKNLELTARQEQRGVWNQTEFPRESHAVEATSTTGAAPPERNPAGAVLVNLNAASYEELQKLPGIGPKLAERIMAHRPFQSAEDLDRVPGIGSATLARLKPLITVEETTR